MKARKVKGLDPDGAFAESLRRIVAMRAGELRELAPAALEPGASAAQHDLRIAAKRLRYVLELAEPALGRPAARGAKRAKRLQELLGELHDCDELAPLVADRRERLLAADAEHLRRAAGDADDLDAALVRAAPSRDAYRGLDTLAAYIAGRRALLHERFVRYWDGLEHEAFVDTLLAGLRPPLPQLSEAERAPAAPPDGGAA